MLTPTKTSPLAGGALLESAQYRVHANVSETLPAYTAVAEQIQSLELSVDPSELHGALCALHCGGSPPLHWLAELMSDAAMPRPAAGSALDALGRITLAQLDADDFGLELLLPDEEVPVNERGEALVAWCRGFLGGIGLAGIEPGLGEEAREVLADVAKIAASDVGYDDPEDDEEALTELVEFVRVATLLIRGESRDADGRGRLH